MKVIIFTNPENPYCDMVKNLLKFYNIEFENLDVSRDMENFKRMMDISGQKETPVIIIDDKVFVGFDREKLKEVLNITQN